MLAAYAYGLSTCPIGIALALPDGPLKKVRKRNSQVNKKRYSRFLLLKESHYVFRLGILLRTLQLYQETLLMQY